MNGKPTGRPFACMALVLMAGCTADIADKGWQPMRPLRKDLDTFRPSTDPRAAAVAQPAMAVEPDGPLTLRQALTLAMLFSPDLAGASWEVRRAEARAIQASLPPNPEIRFEEFGARSVAEPILGATQVFFLSDKLARQKQVALLDRDLAGWDWEGMRIRVYLDTTKAFVALVAAQERLTLAEEILGISQKLLHAIGERVRGGKASPVEEMKAKVELATLRADLEQARQAVQAARLRLAAAWGGTTPQFAKAEGRLEVTGEIPTAEQILGLVEQNPEVARWATEMQRRQAVVRLERRRAIPDVTIGVAAKHSAAEDNTGWIAGVSIPLPIFDRNQGTIRESRYDMARGREEQRATKARVLTEIAEAYQTMASAHARSSILGGDVVPEAQKAFDAALAGYHEGKFPYLDVLDAQRTVFDARGQHLEALAEYLSAVADIEGLIGQGLDTVEGPKAITREAATYQSQEK
jgi:cobalt-zinc-cadmium efflux system outer membrane protein